MRIRVLAGIMFLASVPFLSGCATTSNTAKGAGIGGVLGAGTGAILAQATGGSAGTGAVVGGLAGAILGGAIGNEEDRLEKAALESRVQLAEAQQANAAATQMNIEEVIAMTNAKHSDHVIINQIRTTNSAYVLTSQDLTRLSTSGVSDQVIIEMQNRRPEAAAYHPARLPRHMMVAPPAERVYILRPGPPLPPQGFHVGVMVR
ncbi:MAG: hypothetical protein EXS09_20245 [Gemmataceae bacterium]|nr:hypothetical protein [Gemmataceae bacterium]